MSRHHRFRFKGLDVYQGAMEHFAWAADVVGRMRKGPFVITDQILSASLSIAGNIGEANGREKKWGEVELHYRYAQGSVFEAATHLDALMALGVITDAEYNDAEDRLARISAMLTRLLQAQRRRRTANARPKAERSR